MQLIDLLNRRQCKEAFNLYIEVHSKRGQQFSPVSDHKASKCAISSQS